jgi:hypothetical protein
MTSRQTQLNRLYEAFNQHDLATVMDCLSSDITWPNTLDGGLIVGREAVGAFWRRQFEIVAIEVVPIGFAALPDGRLSVSVQQTVSNLDGLPWSDGLATHIFSFDQDGKISSAVLS